MNNVLKAKLAGNRGFSLIEMIVVMAILSIVMLAVMSLYIPTHQSAVVQTQVSDVQSNLRLGLRQLSTDLLTAGFLVGDEQPVIFEGAAPVAPDFTATDFTIQTRLVGQSFGRVDSTDPDFGDLVLKLTDVNMVDRFPPGSRVRLFEPISATEIDELAVADPVDRVYAVSSVDKANRTITLGGTPTPPADIPQETVVVKVRDAGQPPMQTIRYQLSGGALRRIINGSAQILATNVSDPPASQFAFEFAPTGRVQKVDVTLAGQTKKLKDDLLTGTKQRELQTSIKLRNSY